jgi:ABC-type Na+ efflux pump permease subunit
MRPRKVARIARWEVTRGRVRPDRRTLVFGAALIALLGLVVPAVLAQGFVADRGIYRAGVPADSPYHGPLRSDPTFAVREPSREALQGGRLDVAVIDGRVVYANSAKGRAAAAELRRTLAAHNDRLMANESNRSAAFPVRVSLVYAEQEGRETVAPGGGSENGGGSGGGGGDGGSENGGGADGGVAAGGGPLFGGGGPFGGASGDTPSSIAPPFPFQSLVLAFAFVLPLNFLIQAYGSSVLKERLNRRGELLLVAPVSRAEIIAGKTLPYFLAALGVAAAIVAALSALAGRGGLVSVLAVVPLALLFLATAFLGAMMARSFKELTFVTVAASVFLTSYAFVPAVFTNTGPIALISPLTLVVRDLTGEALSAGELAFATLPATVTGLVLFGFGAGLYREEDMFTQRPISLKFLDALAGRIRRRRSVVLVVALLLPFVFVAELLAVAVLFALPVSVSVPAVLVAVALTEEAAKSLPVYAGLAHDRYGSDVRGLAVAGVLAGVGFVLAEKFTLIAQRVGLPELRVGRAALETTGAATGTLLVVGFLLAPLVLHVVTATLSAAGMSRGRVGYLVGYLLAVGVHLAYNLTVVSGLA